MELWIRSQDKEVLILANHLDIYNVCFDGEVKTWNIEESGINLGEYRTKERALEVLDEIQNLLNPHTQLIGNKDFEGNDIKVYGVEYIRNYVYEMPKK